MTTIPIARTVHATRLGNLTIEASDFGLTRVAFTGDTAPATDTGIGVGRAHVFEAGRQIDEYLGGVRRDFTVPIDWSGVSDFDATVLQILPATGYGETTSYGAIAQRMDRPSGDARKIGGALARNRVLIIVPCHRVLAADGSLTGYAGGLAVKRTLLDLESPATRLALDGI
ncbi:MAG: methylated-DNA-[protein]-cysteine S-methyltransferase [Mycobacterium sp.]|nr:methylated-DNA-[protein]-cysteine S-methyltransferase [Mycobacterium sp.]